MEVPDILRHSQVAAEPLLPIASDAIVQREFACHDRLSVTAPSHQMNCFCLCFSQGWLRGDIQSRQLDIRCQLGAASKTTSEREIEERQNGSRQ